MDFFLCCWLLYGALYAYFKLKQSFARSFASIRSTWLIKCCLQQPRVIFRRSKASAYIFAVDLVTKLVFVLVSEIRALNWACLLPIVAPQETQRTGNRTIIKTKIMNRFLCECMTQTKVITTEMYTHISEFTVNSRAF